MENNNKTFWQLSRVDVVLGILIVDKESKVQAWGLSNTSLNSKATLTLGGKVEWEASIHQYCATWYHWARNRSRDQRTRGFRSHLL